MQIRLLAFLLLLLSPYSFLINQAAIASTLTASTEGAGVETSSATLSNNIDAMLVQADNLRSSDNEYSQLLVKQVMQQSNLSNKQQNYLNYLTALQFAYQYNYPQAKVILLQLLF